MSTSPAPTAAERLASERAARLSAEAEVRRLRVLADTSSLLDGSIEYTATIDKLARLCIPSLGDFCLIDELAGGRVNRLAVAHVDPEFERLLHLDEPQLIERAGRRHPAADVMLTGRPALIESVDEDVLDQLAGNSAYLQRLRQLQLHSLLVVPLMYSGVALGALTLAFGSSRRHYSQDDLEFMEELSRRAAIALHIARLYSESQRAVQARERLLAVVSHDLRNSLATVLLNASAILESQGTSDVNSVVREQLHWIACSAEQMNRLISDLVDVSAIELDRLSLDRSEESAETILDETTAMYRALAAEKDISFSLADSAHLPPVFVDSGRIQQVLGNLVGNAIKFSASGGTIELGAALYSQSEICFTVRDFGSGIDSEHLPAIFELYWQGSRRARAGAGLGLAISKAIVQAHGGRIWVESEVDAGSTFFFTVPVADDTPE